MELSLVIPALNEADNLAKLLPQLRAVLSSLGIEYEIIVVDDNSRDATAEVCAAEGAILIQQTEPGYGGALQAGFEHGSGQYILAMDADLSHTPDFVPAMWNRRSDAELVIASRYVEGGSADMPLYREILSIILNVVYTKILTLPLKDISSGFRLYRASALTGLDLRSNDFDIQEEILIKLYARGHKIIEVPFRYMPRVTGKSKVKLLRFGVSYLKTLIRMWKLRNSIASADYDARAFDSVIPFQRYWQRRRYQIITGMVDTSMPCLDIGCGSSRILGALSDRAIGLDILLGKLLYARCYGRPLVNGSIFALPFSDNTFEQIVCSQVIEHLQPGDQPFTEMVRVLKDSGRLVLGTPDYSRWTWLIVERLYKLFAPDGYGDQHITHYAGNDLIHLMASHGLRFRRVEYVFNSEVILLFEKVRED